MSNKAKCYCGRTATNGYLCADDTKKLATDLARLQWMLPELTTLLTRQVNTHRGGPARRRDDDAGAPDAPARRKLTASEQRTALVPHPLPFDAAASNMLTEARATLAEICRARGLDFQALIGAS